MEQKINRNPAVTKQAIKNAFVELLEEKTFNDVSVAELTRKAGINRVTFYAHYENIYALMMEVETELADRVIATMEGLFRSEDFHKNTSNTFLDMFFSNPQIGIWFMGEQTTGIGEQRIYEYARSVCITEWRKHKQMSDAELERFFDFYYYGNIAFLKKWHQGQYAGDQQHIRDEFIAIGEHVIQYIFG